MNEWTSGYVTDINYTAGYYQELNPIRVSLPMVYSGITPPNIQTACELGFGKGLPIAMHAASSKIKWFGTDFNPSQTSHAREMVDSAKIDAGIFDQSFEEFCLRTDLPDFDFIAMHGIWSWISEDNRIILTDFIRRKLKVGGVLYISYNAMPGWAPFEPLRNLMNQYADRLCPPGQSTISKTSASIAFAKTLAKNDPKYFATAPSLLERLKSLETLEKSYIAHEYFNKDWRPMLFSDVSQYMTSAKLDYACSANAIDNIESILFSKEQLDFLNTIEDQSIRETTKDFILNCGFRRDYWVKGKRQLTKLEQTNKLKQESVVLISPSAVVDFKVNSLRGDVSLAEDIYKPLLLALSDHKPHKISDLIIDLQDALSSSQVVEAIIILSTSGHVTSTNPEPIVKEIRGSTHKLNEYLVSKAYSMDDYKHLASPVTGGGVAVSRFHKLFIAAIEEGKETQQELASFAWEIISCQGERIVEDNRTLLKPEENISFLMKSAESFIKERLPIFKALEITQRTSKEIGGH